MWKWLYQHNKAYNLIFLSSSLFSVICYPTQHPAKAETALVKLINDLVTKCPCPHHNTTLINIWNCWPFFHLNLVGVYIQNKLKHDTERDSCFPMFLAAIFTRVEIWKKKKQKTQNPFGQLSMDKEDVVYIHNEILFSQNKGENPIIFDNMDAPSGH